MKQLFSFNTDKYFKNKPILLLNIVKKIVVFYYVHIFNSWFLIFAFTRVFYPLWQNIMNKNSVFLTMFTFLINRFLIFACTYVFYVAKHCEENICFLTMFQFLIDQLLIFACMHVFYHLLKNIMTKINVFLIYSYF